MDIDENDAISAHSTWNAAVHVPVPGTATERITKPSFCAKTIGYSSPVSRLLRAGAGAMIWPLSDAVIGPGAAIIAKGFVSSVFVPAPRAAVVATRVPVSLSAETANYRYE